MKNIFYRITLAIGLICGIMIPITSSTASATTKEDRLVTIFMSRAIWAEGKKCVPDPQAKTLEDDVAMAYSLGIRVTLGVVTDRIGDTRGCPEAPSIIYPSWNDLHRLVDLYGAEVVSQTKSYTSTIGQDEEYIRDQTCGSLDVLEAHGFDREKAASMLAWGASQYDQTGVDIASECFKFQRIVGNGRNLLPVTTSIVTSQSLNGGYCANVSLPCNTNGMARPYTQLKQVETLGTQNPVWRVIQYYWLVDGTSTGKTNNITWDCTGPTEDHWFHSNGTHEGYCFGDFVHELTWTSLNLTSVTPSEVPLSSAP